MQDPDFTPIGRADLITERACRPVHAGPGGDLSDYIPFYFTPSSPMLFNIVTGRAGVRQVAPADLVVLTASLLDIAEAGIPFVITDRHAVVGYARHYASLDALGELDWPQLRSCDFRNDAENPLAFERYQAEALVYGHLPPALLRGIGCYDDDAREYASEVADRAGQTPKVRVVRDWFLI